GDRGLELGSLIERATLAVILGPLFDPDRGLALSERALELAEVLGDRAAQATIRWNQMRAIVQLGADPDLAVRAGEQSLAIARELGLREQLAYSLNDLQYAYRAQGQFGRALENLAEARALWGELGNQHMLADNLNQAVIVHLYRGEYSEALALAAEAEQ